MKHAMQRKDRCWWCGWPLTPVEGIDQQAARSRGEFCSGRCRDLWHQRMAQLEADHLALVEVD
jgi:hypothetical protein